jgi:hypothetical protein
MNSMNLPSGVTRDRDARQDVALENCELLKFGMRDQRGGATSINISRRGPVLVRPERWHSRIRDVRPFGKRLARSGRAFENATMVSRQISSAASSDGVFMMSSIARGRFP